MKLFSFEQIRTLPKAKETYYLLLKCIINSSWANADSVKLSNIIFISFFNFSFYFFKKKRKTPIELIIMEFIFILDLILLEKFLKY